MYPRTSQACDFLGVWVKFFPLNYRFALSIHTSQNGQERLSVIPKFKIPQGCFI